HEGLIHPSRDRLEVLVREVVALKHREQLSTALDLDELLDDVARCGENPVSTPGCNHTALSEVRTYGHKNNGRGVPFFAARARVHARVDAPARRERMRGLHVVLNAERGHTEPSGHDESAHDPLQILVVVST